MPLDWNEVRSRAFGFAKRWEDEGCERAEAQTFWNELFEVFGLNRRRVAMYEKYVKKLPGKKKSGFIDLLWPGVLMAEHKSRGESLDSAYEQVANYFAGLKETEIPSHIIVSDFARIRLLQLSPQREWEFPLKELPDRVRLFSFMLGLKAKEYQQQSPVTAEAGLLLGALHDLLKDTQYSTKHLEEYLVRLLFCLFADDTHIFNRKDFAVYVGGSKEDGTDLGGMLGAWFEVLNTPQDKRSNALSELLAALPYVNGRLFDRQLPTAAFTGKMRSILLECCDLDWSTVCPSVFGNLFQSIMNPQIRREQGAHYTAEKNIRKVIEPLFLDDLRAEFESVKRNNAKLSAFHKKLWGLRFLDPACGCGNFLVVAYRELRLLEIEVVKALHRGNVPMEPLDNIRMNVDQFYGIEADEFAVQVAKVALWLTDHQMNNRVSEEFGQMYIRLPLVTSPNIVQGNSLRTDWAALVQPLASGANGPGKIDFIFGNPPFVGARFMSEQQRADMREVFGKMRGAGELDYVCAWYKRAAEYSRVYPHVHCAYVSTNSITQGEQPAYLWQALFQDDMLIDFAHRTFKWQNEGRKKAAVHVVVIGFGKFPHKKRRLYSYEDITEEPTEESLDNITPYLMGGETVLIFARNIPIGTSRRLGIGNQAIDHGYYLFETDEMKDFVRKEPGARKYFKRWLGAEEFIHNKKQWRLILQSCSINEIRNMPLVKERVEKVRAWRLTSKREQTRKLADRPTHFQVERFFDKQMLVIPQTSSELRQYIPIGFVSPEIVISEKAFVLDADMYSFGILESAAHMTWMRAFAGRLESRYSYSASMVYNNFPWPSKVSASAKAKVETCAQAVLNARENHPDCTLATLYDDTLMPDDLRKAHRELDKAVDDCYGRTFKSERERVEYLLGLYKQEMQRQTVQNTVTAEVEEDDEEMETNQDGHSG